MIMNNGVPPPILQYYLHGIHGAGAQFSAEC